MERRTSVLAKHNYELLFIVSPELNAEEQEALLQRIKGYLEEAEAHIYAFREWGLRHLTYEIAGQHEGYYFMIQFAMDAHRVAEFGRSLRLLEGVIRELIIRMDEHEQPGSEEKKSLSFVPDYDNEEESADVEDEDEDEDNDQD